MRKKILVKQKYLLIKKKKKDEKFKKYDSR